MCTVAYEDKLPGFPYISLADITYFLSKALIRLEIISIYSDLLMPRVFTISP